MEGIPFLDLVTPHQQLKDELTAVFHRTLETAGFVGGPMVANFERAFAEFCGTRECIGVATGTDALRFALMALIQPGDVVVTVPNTFIATTEAISQAGAFPEFVDMDERTYTMDPAKLRAYLEQGCSKDSTGKLLSKRSGKPVTAIIPVHLYGAPADMDPILELAERYNLIVIEDACQAHGAEYFSRKQNRWLKCGSMGRAAAFSFYPGKNLGALGEGGAVTTNDAEVARQVRLIREHGSAEKYYHDMEGYNGRLHALQAGLLHVKLPHLAQWSASRLAAAKRYNEMFAAAGAPVVTPFIPTWAKPVFHLYVIQVDDRKAVQQALAAEKIGSGIHYPIPLHLQKAYAGMGLGAGSFPVSEKASVRILSLPMFPNLTEADQKRVVETVVRSTQAATLAGAAAAR
ncbi:MAG TPA: DegT/DnrJ/EryC1/StrS family aminotransferase [Terriglobales bacterium]|nr:DegT/DnrJ/EryC1/StrS family aminotransferase [Terriglobales bacterium]